MLYNRDNRGGAMTRRPQEGLSRQRGADWLWQRDPWQEMQEMQRRMDQMVSRVFGGEWPGFSTPMGQWAGAAQDWNVAEPDMDFTETESEYMIKASLPGISPSDIDLQATEDSIRLTAQTSTASEPQQGQQSSNGNANQAGGGSGGQNQQGQTTQHRQGQFSRVSRFAFAYSLPEDIKPNEVSANYRNGILELKLPKARANNQQSRSVTIPIQGAEQPAQISAGSSGQGRAAGTQAQSVSSAGGTAQQGASGANAASEHQAGSRSGDGAGSKKGASKSGQVNVETATANSK